MTTGGKMIAAAALALLAGCGPGPAGGKVAATNAAEAPPAKPTADERATAGYGPITAEWFAGRWSTDRDCSSIATFSADGRFVNTIGERGTWSIADNHLTLTRNGESATIPLERAGPNAIDGIGNRGRTRQYRC
jgi:hypothetical protein